MRSSPVIRYALVPLALLLFILAATYALYRPILIHKEAQKRLEALNAEFHGGYTPTPPNWYWKQAARFDVEPIRVVRIPAGKGNAENLRFLRQLSELEDLRMSFADLDDESAAKLIRSLPKLESIFLNGTYAGQKTGEAILNHPTPWRRIQLKYCPLPETMVEKIYALDGFRWEPPLSPEAREAAQALGPDITFYHRSGRCVKFYINLPTRSQDLAPAEVDRHLRTLLEDWDPFPAIDANVKSQQVARATALFEGITVTNLVVGGSSGSLSWLGAFEKVEHLQLIECRDLIAPTGPTPVAAGLATVECRISSGSGWPFDDPKGLSKLVGGRTLDALEISKYAPHFPLSDSMVRDIAGIRSKHIALPAGSSIRPLLDAPALEVLEVLSVEGGVQKDEAEALRSQRPEVRLQSEADW